MNHDTHTICNKRLNQKGEKNCCWCVPHSHCEFKEPTHQKQECEKCDCSLSLEPLCDKTCSCHKVEEVSECCGAESKSANALEIALGVPFAYCSKCGKPFVVKK